MKICDSQLLVITGKGGVGKTTLSFSIAKHLKEAGHDVLYCSFDQVPDIETCDDLGIDAFELEVSASTEKYLQHVLGSETIASIVMRAPFFKSLLNVLPGLSHMILFGHIIDQIQKNPGLRIVLDAPSTGHAITMLESPSNFKAIFRKGLLVKDIDRMQNFMNDPKMLSVYITLQPTQMAVSEGIELKETIGKLGIEEVNLVMNSSLVDYSRKKHTESDIPDFISRKIELEKTVLKQYKDKISGRVPLIAKNDKVQIYKDISKLIKQEKES